MPNKFRKLKSQTANLKTNYNAALNNVTITSSAPGDMYNNILSDYPKHYFAEEIMKLPEKTWEQYFMSVRSIGWEDRDQVLNGFIEKNIQHPLIFEYINMSKNKNLNYEYKIYNPNR